MSPEMVIKEFYVTILGYNHVCDAMTAAGELRDVPMRRLSFTRSCVHLLTNIVEHLANKLDELGWSSVLKCIGKQVVPHRPGRIEPREIKVRQETYKRMMQPREERLAELMKNWE